METVMAKLRVLETTGQQIMTTLSEHIRKNWNIFGAKKYEIEWSCDKWSGYKRPWFHSYFIILSTVSHHYGSSSQTTTCPGINSVRWSKENIVALQHQHQQIVRQHRLRRQRQWWCWPWLLRLPALCHHHCCLNLCWWMTCWCWCWNATIFCWSSNWINTQTSCSLWTGSIMMTDYTENDEIWVESCSFIPWSLVT